jgi:hypothetical protein
LAAFCFISINVVDCHVGIYAAEFRHKPRDAARENPIEPRISARYEQDFARKAFRRIGGLPKRAW